MFDSLSNLWYPLYIYDVTYDKKQFIKACSDVICAGAGEE